MIDARTEVPAPGPVVDLGAGAVGKEIPAWLSRQPLKRALYGVDLYFREGWEESVAAAGSATQVRRWLDDHTLILLKPDAVVRRRLNAVMTWLARSGITLLAVERVPATRHVTRALWEYQWNIATRDRRDVSELMMCRSDCLLLVVRMPTGDVPAAVRLSALKGPANPAEQSPAHLRWAMGTINYIINGAHTPDEPADVLRELSVLLTAEQRARVRAALGTGRRVDPGPAVRECYGQVPAEPDLHLSARRTRWREDVARLDMVAGSDEREFLTTFLDDEASAAQAWRRFADAMALHCPRWSAWDTVVLGTSYAPAHLDDLERILPGVPASDWLNHRTAPG